MTCRCRSGECDPECDGPMLRAEIERYRRSYDSAAKEIEELRRDIERLRAALDRCMIGGNHLATYHKTTWPEPGSDPAKALEALGAGWEYDMWCCWGAIMCARDALQARKG
jgi:hypothetical protein